MPTTGNRRQLDPTPLYAVVGVTDLAVARARSAQADAQRALSGFDAKSAAQEVPTRAVALALTAAGKAEQQYEEFAKRGKSLYQRVRAQQSTQDLVSQAGNTLSRGKGAVTTARKAADDTATAVRGTLGVGRREAEQAATTTRRSAKKTTTRATKNASATKSAAKGTRTSARKTASKATTAAKSAAEKTGN